MITPPNHPSKQIDRAIARKIAVRDANTWDRIAAMDLEDRIALKQQVDVEPGDSWLDEGAILALERATWEALPEVMDVWSLCGRYVEYRAVGKTFNEGNLVTAYITSKAVRDVIKDFSTKARRNMIKAVARLRALTPYFLTLTYPEAFPSPAEAKRHLEVFAMRFLRRYPGGFFIWKMEPQARGAVHFHLLLDPGQVDLEAAPLGDRQQVGFYRGKPDFITKGWVAEAWYEIVGSGDEKHLRRGTDLRDLRMQTTTETEKMVMAYVSKYMGKVTYTDAELATAWATPGRWWGIKGRANYAPACTTPENFVLEGRDAFKVRRSLRRLVEHRKGGQRYAKWMGTHGTGFVMVQSDTVRDLMALAKGVKAPEAPGRGAAWGSAENAPKGQSRPSDGDLRKLWDSRDRNWWRQGWAGMARDLVQHLLPGVTLPSLN